MPEYVFAYHGEKKPESPEEGSEIMATNGKPGSAALAMPWSTPAPPWESPRP